jgi:ATP-dependent RNA helicase SUPV3L1/SUV3
VQRRLQHFIDRKIAALFEPLVALSKDEALTGLARGFAFRMVENFGILPRADIADDVKALDQDARGALRKHGIRFGQFTIFMQALLKPAPTRLRLVLWSLVKGLQEFPESPPPGLVTIPVDTAAPEGADTMSGYRNAGTRAIRIDMLERLADMLRSEDSRGGFEAKADMLSITGMTLEQFAALMEGLGYRAEKSERTKVKAVDTVIPHDGAQMATDKGADADTPVMDVAAEQPAGGIVADPAAAQPDDIVPETASISDEGIAPIISETPEVSDHIADTAAGENPLGTAPDASIAGAETEVFYVFTWGRPVRANQSARRGGGERPQGKGKPAPRGKKGGQRDAKGGNKSQSSSARPPKAEKPIDPDNPFAAALMGLKTK